VSAIAVAVLDIQLERVVVAFAVTDKTGVAVVPVVAVVVFPVLTVVV
jgi:hypothetical protein